METEKSKEPTANAVSDYLEQRASEIDPETQQQLDRMRARAVALAEQQAELADNRWRWLPTAGYAAAFSLAVTAGVIAFNSQPNTHADEASPLELVLLNEDFELLDEDLAFYDWVEGELGGRG